MLLPQAEFLYYLDTANELSAQYEHKERREKNVGEDVPRLYSILNIERLLAGLHTNIDAGFLTRLRL